MVMHKWTIAAMHSRRRCRSHRILTCAGLFAKGGVGGSAACGRCAVLADGVFGEARCNALPPSCVGASAARADK